MEIGTQERNTGSKIFVLGQTKFILCNRKVLLLHKNIMRSYAHGTKAALSRTWKARECEAHFCSLAKMYTEDLHGGQDYSRLKKCISISILDFNVTEGEEYHSVYRLRNQYGEEYTNIWEIHLIELRKALGKNQRMDEWVRFFRIRTKEDLNSVC